MSRQNVFSQLTLNARIGTIIVGDDFKWYQCVCAYNKIERLKDSKDRNKCIHCRFFYISYWILVTVRSIFPFIFEFLLPKTVYFVFVLVLLIFLFSILHFYLRFDLFWAFWPDDSFNQRWFYWYLLIHFVCYFIPEQTSIKTKKDDPFVQHLWEKNRLGAKRTDQADMLVDIAIPLLIIVGLLVVNGFIVLIIWRHRKKRYVFLYPTTKGFWFVNHNSNVRISISILLYRKNQQDADEFAQL